MNRSSPTTLPIETANTTSDKIERDASALPRQRQHTTAPASASSSTALLLNDPLLISREVESVTAACCEALLHRKKSKMPSLLMGTSHCPPTCSSPMCQKKRKLCDLNSATQGDNSKEQQQQQPEDERPGKRVRFSSQDMTRDCTSPYYLHDEEGLDDAEACRRKNQIWYSRDDYQRFLEDRVATIQVWRSLQGQEFGKDLEDFYCLRGLEPYQSPSLHSELLAHRAIYVQTVLEEQWRAWRLLQMQHQEQQSKAAESSSTSNKLRPEDLQEKILPHVQHMTDWAMKRAQHLAEIDARDAHRIHKPVSEFLEDSVSKKKNKRTKKPRISRRRSCAALPSTLPPPRLMRRVSSPTLPQTARSVSPPDDMQNAGQHEQEPNDKAASMSLLPPGLQESHRRNRLLMQQIRLQNQLLQRQQQQHQHNGRTASTATTSAAASSLDPVVGYKAGDHISTTPSTDRVSLHSLLRAGYRERQQQQRTPLSCSWNVSSLSRRLLQEQNAAFQMVRRDSLHGLRSGNRCSNQSLSD